MLINANGEAFMNPLETRDVSAASIIRECSARGNGVKTPAGYAVWLDTPMIEIKNGEGTIAKRIPAMMRMFGKYGIDIRKEPILVYPTLHYQNGGVKITVDGQSMVENLFVAGEAVGGIHGRNRLMGNSCWTSSSLPQRRQACRRQEPRCGARHAHAGAYRCLRKTLGRPVSRLTPSLPSCCRTMPAEKMC